MNTAYYLGSDAVKLLVWLHGRCEIHGWVGGPNRSWLAGIIERGRVAGVLRAEVGWEGVAALLRARDDRPVVMSYSVTESFPGSHCTDWQPPDIDAWYDLSHAEQWRLSLAALYRQDEGRRFTREMRPDTWEDHRFGEGIIAYDLRAMLQA